MAGFEIAGVIDEVCRKARPRPPSPKTPTSTPYRGKGKSSERARDQRALDGFFGAPQPRQGLCLTLAGIKPALPVEPAYGYFLMDHKTRYVQLAATSL